MAFKKYTATKDTTITNLFITDEDVTSRVTGSNTGLSDTLEVFSIYNAVSSSTTGPSSELSRILIEFPVTTIASDRTAETIPGAGNVNFFLKLYNQPHTAASPIGYDIEALPLSGAWEEGYGVDHVTYKDVTKDKTGANWMRANGTDASGSATIKIISSDAAAQDSDQQITLVSTDGTSRTYIPKNGGSEANGATIGGDATQIRVNIAGLSTQGGIATKFKEAIEATAGHTSDKLTVTLSTVTNTNDTLTIKQTTTGYGGNTIIPAITNGNANLITVNGDITATAFTGGSGTWANVGAGDIAIKTGSAVSGISEYQATGSQHLEMNITSFVEDWLANTYTNYGLLVKITDQFEALNTVASSVETTNTVGVAASFYTKKFYSRTSDQVFFRPVIEARWDDSNTDDRANFYFSSSLAPAADNLNKLYFYNKIRGRFSDVPGITDGNPIKVSFFTSSAGTPGTGSLTVVTSGGETTEVTAAKSDTGIYTCSVGIASGALGGTIYDVWYTGSSAPYDILYRGQITPKTFSGDDYYGNTKYIFKVTNGKLHYNINDSQRIRLYTRAKNITPNIFTVSQNTTDVTIIPELYYRVVRTYDDLEVIPFGTGSTNHTKMSYDASGSYFDFDFSNLQQNFEYKFEFAYYEDYAGDHIVHPYSFKFRTSE